jgi:hypothetical protein
MFHHAIELIMEKNKEGSGLLIIIILMSGFVLYLSSIWHATVHLAHISLLREQYEKEYSATLGLMNWAIDLTKTNFDIISNEASTEINLKWPPKSKNSFDATVTFEKLDEKHIAICARTTHESQANCILKASLARQIIEKDEAMLQYQYSIHDWRHETS